MNIIKASVLFVLLNCLVSCGMQLVEFPNPVNIPPGDSDVVPPVVVPPTVTFVVPANGETDVAINRKIVATFSEAMDPLSIVAENYKVTGPSGPVLGIVSYSINSHSVTFSPDSNLEFLSDYEVLITTGVKDVDGNNMMSDYVWNFRTASFLDVTAPTIVLTDPMDLAIDVPVDQKIMATFDEMMDPGTVVELNYTVTDGLISIEGIVTYDVLIATAAFSPVSPLSPDTTYVVLVTGDVTDLAGNALVSGLVPNPWSFKTAAVIIPPFVGINMGLAAPFAIAATAGITNTITSPITHINGDVVLDPNFTCNAVPVDNAGGFGLCNSMAPTINGTVITNTYPDTTTSSAVKADLNAAFLSITPLAGPPAVGSLGGGTSIAAPTTMGDITGNPMVLGDNYFTPGVWTSITSILVTGDITLDGQGDPNAMFIFQSASSLTTAAGAPAPGAHTRILLVNGAKASNVWWQVGSSATLGLYTEFQGNILAAYDITMNTGATSCGRLMAGAWVGGSGAFVFDSNIVSVPGNGCPF